MRAPRCTGSLAGFRRQPGSIRVPLFERHNAQLEHLSVDGDLLVFAEQRLERMPLGVLVTSDYTVLTVQLP